MGDVAPTPVTLYELVGGERWFVDLVGRFYDRVEDDPLLRPLYPADLAPSRAHLAGFLVQYWGGPATYSAERGHPRLRMRHFPFHIGQAERDTWFAHMRAALAQGGLAPEVEEQVLAYFDTASTHLINAEG
jgi:hemoglobin